MKVTSVVLALGLGAALGGAPVASAEDVPVTLAEALALAGQANPELQAAAARVDAQARPDRVGPADALAAPRPVAWAGPAWTCRPGSSRTS